MQKIKTFLNKIVEMKNKHFNIDYTLLNQMTNNENEKIQSKRFKKINIFKEVQSSNDDHQGSNHKINEIQKTMIIILK